MAQESPGLQEPIDDCVTRSVVDEFDDRVVGPCADRVWGVVEVEPTVLGVLPCHLPIDQHGMVWLRGGLLVLGVAAIGGGVSARKQEAR